MTMVMVMRLMMMVTMVMRIHCDRIWFGSDFAIIAGSLGVILRSVLGDLHSRPGAFRGHFEIRV